LLTGKPPYGGRTTSYVLASVLADEEENGPGDGALPAVDAIMRAIEREPDDRWQSAAAFAQALAAAIGSSREKPRVAGRRMGCLPAAAAVLVLAAVLRALQR
jgi:eukaryotic-like serine/threonine-protein kinase